jgi:hypothetical protein
MSSASSEQPFVPLPVRPAATVMLVRDGDDGIEVFLMRRHRAMEFVGGVIVFPGGGVDDRDRNADIDWHGPPPSWWAQRLGVDEDLALALVSRVRSSGTSSPAQNISWPPNTMTAATSVRIPSSAAVVAISRHICRVSVFVGGRDNSRVPTPSPTCALTNSFTEGRSRPARARCVPRCSARC